MMCCFSEKDKDIEQKEEFAISESLILVKQDAKDSEEIMNLLSSLLEKQGYVKPSYQPALFEREKVFPTGLNTKVTGVAIPHADACHVNIPAIAVATLAKPVIFKEMARLESTVAVEIVIMLAIKDPDSQIKMLQKIMQILHDEDILTGLQNAQTSGEIKRLITEHLAG